MRSTTLFWLGMTACSGAFAFGAASAARDPGAGVSLAKAIQVQQALVAQEPQNASAQVDLGNLLLLAARAREAEAAYRKGIELDPQDAVAHYDLGLLLRRRGKKLAAFAEFRRVVKLDPDNAWAHYKLGEIAEGWGLRFYAVRHYARAFALAPRLRFPDVNPAVLDSHLMTESMLEAYRGYAAEAQPPLLYEDPGRLTSLLMETQRAEEAAKHPAPEPAAAQPPAAKTPARPRPGAVGAPAANPEQKVLRPGDLDLGRHSIGQSTPAPPGVAGAARRPAFNAPAASGAAVPRAGSQRGFGVPGAAAPPSAYVPLIPSTGRLEMELYDTVPAGA